MNAEPDAVAEALLRRMRQSLYADFGLLLFVCGVLSVVYILFKWGMEFSRWCWAEPEDEEEEDEEPPEDCAAEGVPTFEEWDRKYMLGNLPEDRRKVQCGVRKEPDGTIILEAKEPSRYHRNLIPPRRSFTRRSRPVDEL